MTNQNERDDNEMESLVIDNVNCGAKPEIMELQAHCLRLGFKAGVEFERKRAENLLAALADIPNNVKETGHSCYYSGVVIRALKEYEGGGE